MEEKWMMMSTCCILLLITALWKLMTDLYWRPRALVAMLNKQGIYGPPPKFLKGNISEILTMRGAVKDNPMETFSHNVVERALPDYVKWSKQYGKRFAFFWGTEVRLAITEPELIREVLSKKTSEFEKSKAQLSIVSLVLGRGLVAVVGDEWVHHRQLVSPAFYLDRLKGMTGVMTSCTSSMLDKWEDMMPEVEVCSEMSKLTAVIISRTAFGSSHSAGQKVFEILTQKLSEPASKLIALSWIPGNMYLPFPANFKMRQCQREMDRLLTEIIDERRTAVKESKCNSYGNDLLGLMLKECEGDTSFTYRDLIDECKTFYVAGHQTTSRLLSWALMLLAGHTHWQERARAEVREVCGDDVPDGDKQSKLKLIGMILYETLRLYPPSNQIDRTCFKDTWLRDIFVPKGVAVTFPIIAIHHDKELWGEDADEFKPERFRDGVSNACKHPNAFMPFSLGPRVCVGQSFAMIEAKVALALILQRFSFQLSPNYRHNPAQSFGLHPVHGIQLNLNKLQ